MKLEIPFLLLLAFFVLSGCGQKGDLYRTEDAPPPQMEEPEPEVDSSV
jgi:predicted small lipoprotein YifL